MIAKGSGGSDAKKAFNSDASIGQGALGTSSNLMNTLVPEATKEITNPTGYGASGLAAMNTAAGQSAAGSAARARGEGLLSGARTGNAGAYTGGADEAQREATRTMANAALGTQAANENLKQKQRQEGMSVLSGLNADQLKLLESSMGAENQANKNEIDASQNNWFNNLMKFVQTGAQASAIGAGIAK